MPPTAHPDPAALTAAVSAAARFAAARRLLQPAEAELRITGQVVRQGNAWATSGRDPHALVSVVVSTGQGCRYHAQVDLGAGFDAHLQAHRLAHALRVGEVVTVVCAGARAQWDSERTALVCTGVRSIQPAEQPLQVA